MKKKWFLYLTAFMAGMSIMAIEIGASRLLSPYFSSSQIIWTIIIGVIMIALATGNLIGGKIADKSENPNKLFTLLFACSIWVALIPLVGKFIIAGISLGLATFIKTGFLVWASSISCILIFFFPLMTLGMVTPNLVKFAVKDIDESGKVVGRIEALNTTGSIIGTFLPTFVTIPIIGTTFTFVTFASILFIICMIYFFSSHSKVIVRSILIIISLGLSFVSSKISFAFWQDNILYEGESIYNYLRVEEDGNKIYLSTNVLFGVQSIYFPGNSLTGMYYDYALAASVASFSSSHNDCLILGLATGTFARNINLFYSDVSIDGVEIDGDIVKLAKKYFNLSENVNPIVDDGRHYIESTSKIYDCIMVDAYQDITIPFGMSSLEFFREINKHLSSNGVMVVNLNMYSEDEGTINDYLSSTITHVFDYVYVYKVGTNGLLFASNGFDFIERLEDNSSVLTNYQLRNISQQVISGSTRYYDKGYLLTDDKAPVELLGIKMIDKMIESEITYIQEMIKGKSLREILEFLS